MPQLSQNYYYSIPFTEKGQYGRQKLYKRNRKLLLMHQKVSLLIQVDAESFSPMAGIRFGDF